MRSKISIANKSRGKIPRISFAKIKAEVLGSGYKLSLVFTDAAAIRKLNKVYRGKDSPTDILSFPISKTEGEIYICPSEAKKESAKFARSYSNFMAFLFIHGCTHLKGYDHSATMESIETKFRNKFGV